MNNKNGIILIDKGEGVTSFQCLNTIKKTVNKKTGHCGTLDKFASGLMIALCGSYTKMNEKFMGLDKTYIAKIEFGKETETLDPEGQVLYTAEVPSINTILSNVKNFVGQIEQIPPVYSAIHVNGKRSYNLARNGKEVSLSPRKVVIYSSEILSTDLPFVTVKIHVSKGTYIRSYARDLGLLCGSRAYVKELRRISIGPFDVEHSIPFDNKDALCSYDELSSEVVLRQLENYILPTV